MVPALSTMPLDASCPEDGLLCALSHDSSVMASTLTFSLFESGKVRVRLGQWNIYVFQTGGKSGQLNSASPGSVWYRPTAHANHSTRLPTGMHAPRALLWWCSSASTLGRCPGARCAMNHMLASWPATPTTMVFRTRALHFHRQLPKRTLPSRQGLAAFLGYACLNK